MGLLGKVFKKVAESADDKKKSDKTATSMRLHPLEKPLHILTNKITVFR